MTGARPDSETDRSSGPQLIRPLVDFLSTEAAGGVVLIIATVVALVWANSPWRDSYEQLWHTQLAITLGSWSISLDLREWVNEALMTVFFFVVGLEIKRELVEGELRDPRRAALPALGAVGGMMLPAALYLLLNAGGEGSAGWAIPTATDIAIAVGVLALLGKRVAPSLRLFLLALAIVDDIGAIVIIALFFTNDINYAALAGAAGLIVLVVGARAFGVRSILVHIALGIALWLALHESGVHSTLVGVVLGLLAPTQPFRRRALIDREVLTDLSTVRAARETAALARDSVSVVEWLEHILHPWTSFVILPLFALANAGIPLGAEALAAASSSRITYGVVLGLVIGKTLGISLFAWLSVRLRIGLLPDGASWRGILGVAAVAGIGFTVSIFIAGLAFAEVALQDQAKVGILFGSLIAAILGTLIISSDARIQATHDTASTVR